MTSIAYVITNPRNGFILEEFGKMTGKVGTNNDAEYEAAIMGVARCVELGATEVTLCVDSQVLQRQVLGEYKCRHDNLAARLRILKSHSKQLDVFKVLWVRRAENSQADMLCNRAMELFRHQRGMPTRTEARKLRAQARRA